MSNGDKSFNNRKPISTEMKGIEYSGLWLQRKREELNMWQRRMRFVKRQKEIRMLDKYGYLVER